MERYDLIDKATGEVLDAKQIITPKKVPSGFHEGFNMIGLFGCEYLTTLGAEGKLKQTDFTVLFKLLTSNEYENKQGINIAKLARDLDKDRSQVSKAIKSLESHQLFERYKDEDGLPKLYLNPHYFWRGRPALHRKAIRQYDKEHSQKPKL